LLKDLVAFDLDKEFDQDTYLGRLQFNMSRLNPLLFFHSDRQIKEAHEIATSYRMRLEAARNMGQPVLMKPEEVERVKKASRVAGCAVHPDTN